MMARGPVRAPRSNLTHLWPLILAMATGASAAADGTQPACAACSSQARKAHPGHHRHTSAACGTLGYGPPGLHPGFQGFGLGYHPGYGYGGRALGVGAFGGDPLYGGPGYPHPGPSLRRCGGITPFTPLAGPGYATAEHPNFYGPVGPLVADRPVVTVGDDMNDDTGYGYATGALPYSEAFLAPYTTRAAAGGGSSSRMETPDRDTTLPPSAGTGSAPSDDSAAGTIPTLGIEVEASVDRNGARCLKITRILPGSVMDPLRLGDLLLSVNGYRTERPGNLSWILANPAAGKLHELDVQYTSDGYARAATIQIARVEGRDRAR